MIDWIAFVEQQPKKKGIYLVWKGGKWRKAWWDKIFVIYPESESEDERINIYDEYIPDYWAKIDLPIISQKEISMPEKPLCINCRHITSGLYGPHPVCNHPEAPHSLVDGEPFLACVDLRSSEKEIVIRVGTGTTIELLSEICGSEGRWFEAKK